MHPLKIYRIESQEHGVLHIAARSSPQAAEIFVTWEATQGLIADRFTVELMPTNDLGEPQRRQLALLLATAAEGIARRDEDDGWSIDSEGWFSFDSSGEGAR